MLIFLVISRITSALEASGISLSGQNPSLYLDQPSHPVKLYLDSDNFNIGNNYVWIQYQTPDNIYLNVTEIKGGTALEINNEFTLDGFAQWRMVVNEDFSNPQNWSNNKNSECAGITMLGGYCQFSQTEASKTFANLPPHKQLKIKATFHFIDAWIGETAYMKASIDGKLYHLWTENYKAGQASKGINVCGGHHAEGKFSSPIEVTLPHTDSQLEVVFGANLDQDPCDESWGVSAFMVYVR